MLEPPEVRTDYVVGIRKKHARDVAELIISKGYTPEQAALELRVSVNRIKCILAGDVAHIPTQHLMDMRTKLSGKMCGC
ncbi:MAG: hypothetical protein ABI475_07610 [Methylophilaceae bacterium]